MDNEERYEGFLKSFLEDGNYRALVEAVEEHDCKKAFTAAHTLKGVSGNLALSKLFEVVQVQVEYFRQNKFDNGALMMDKVTQEYNNIVGVIKELLF